MKRKITFVLLCITGLNVNAQELPVKDFIYNLVYKNIAAYNIKYASFSNNGIHFNDPLKSSSDFFFDKLLPDKDFRMNLEISEVKDLVYPLSNYFIFSISTNGLNFQNPTTGVSRSFVGARIGSKYLVAVDTLNHNIKFLSGQFFNSTVIGDFSLSKEEPESYINFIKVRGYLWLVENVTFLKKKGRKLYFNCYSGLYKKNAMVVLDLKKPEFLRLIESN